MAQPAMARVASVTLILCLLVTESGALRTPQKAVNAYCIYDSDISELTMVFLADYNGDPVDKVLPLTERIYNRETNNEAACDITYQTSENIEITSVIYTDGSKADYNLCGGRKTVNTLDEYEWTIELREHWNNYAYTELDRRYLIKCKLQDAASNMITTSIRVYGEDKEENGTRYKADNEMSVLEYRGNSWEKWTGGTNGLPLNQEIKFRIQSKLDEEYEPYLYYYGNSPFLCTRSVSSTFNPAVGPTVDFIGLNSCPTQQDPFGLQTGFTKADAQVQPNGFYNMETEAFVFARGSPGNYPSALRYFVRCYLKYCHGPYDENNPANNDQMCENPCAANTKRKKRSTSLYDHDQVVLTIDIDPSRSAGGGTEGQDSTSRKLSQTTLISIIAVIGALIVVMAIVVTCLLCVARRRRRYQSDDSSSEKSTKVLPVYQIPKA